MDTFWHENTVDHMFPFCDSNCLKSQHQHRFKRSSSKFACSIVETCEVEPTPRTQIWSTNPLWSTKRSPGVSTVAEVSVSFGCALFLLLHSPAKVFFLELLELLLCKQRLRLLGLLGGSVRVVPGLSPCIVVLDLSETESKSTLYAKL